MKVKSYEQLKAAIDESVGKISSGLRPAKIVHFSEMDRLKGYIKQITVYLKQTNMMERRLAFTFLFTYTDIICEASYAILTLARPSDIGTDPFIF
ncbi:hypothetical protein [Brevibacillus dissolubilis]|uniref:hypothetical protein n=1 Tax=Brevibacillus dissolubilis TaxID=1844116 RepID=UPI001117530F|nr:hypothetical protein [Brevibacillus dissolubilis]